MKTLIALFVSWLLFSGQLIAQHTIFFVNGHSGRASVIEFKEKTVLLKSFDSPRSPIQEIPKNSIDRIVMADSIVLTATDISQRRSPADQVALFIKKEASRSAADDGLPRPVAFEWSNFLGQSLTLANVRHTENNTILTFIHKNYGLFGTQFVISSATYLYNRQDVREAFRISKIVGFDLDVPITIPASVDSLQYELYFERVKPGLEEVNFKSMPIATGLLGGPASGYLITGLLINNPLVASEANGSASIAMTFGASKLSCITCGNVGKVRCPNCLGNGTIKTTKHIPVSLTNRKDYRIVSQETTCPVCEGKGSYICPNRPNHPEVP
ncbi:DnaJ-like cysteine-rich domain-containing protein [Spirosoma litoris]